MLSDLNKVITKKYIIQIHTHIDHCSDIHTDNMSLMSYTQPQCHYLRDLWVKTNSQVMC